MTDEKGAEEEMDEGQLDDEIDADKTERALIPAEIDLLKEAGAFRLIGDVIQEIVEESRIHSLSPNQIEAAALVAMGLKDSEVATLVGVKRQTVNVWKNHNLYFKAEVTKKQAEIWETYKVQYRTLVPRAIDALGKALDYGDEKMRMKAATLILRSLKLE